MIQKNQHRTQKISKRSKNKIKVKYRQRTIDIVKVNQREKLQKLSIFLYCVKIQKIGTLKNQWGNTYKTDKREKENKLKVLVILEK